METRKKRKTSNLLMAALIAVVAICGIMVTGSIKGWFGGGDSVIACEDITGAVNIERDGVAYSMKADQGIQDGDILETKTGSEAVLKLAGDNTLTMNENTELAIREGTRDSIKLEVTAGEMFADTPDAPETFEITFGENKAIITGTVFSISMQHGSASLNVYEGDVKVAAEDGKEHEVTAGNTLSIVHTEDGKLEAEVIELKTAGLSNFILEKAQGCESADKLCFTASELQKVADERNAEKSNADGSGDTITADGKNSTTDGGTAESSGSKSNKNEVTTSGSASGSSNGSSGSTSKNDVKTCTIQIQCDTILSNMRNLTAGKDRYVPANGVILATSTVEFKNGETVFDVLQRVCSYTGIPLEYSWTPMYNSYYIEGINNLYEFDCGSQSGWMYKVNGWFPNYGCSSYTLSDGDSIVWMYTCNGLGADVGGGM